jgi:diguanylate cyclase (GGDEF)-like protein
MSASTHTGASRAAEIVPLSDRSRYMNGLRAVIVALVGAIVLVAPGSLTAPRDQLVLATVGYALAGLLSAAVFARAKRSQRLIFGALLLLDALYLAWAAYATGAAASPLRFVMVVHVIAVALLASYRTGLKLALWHSLLLVVAFHAQQGGLLEPVAALGIGIGTPFQRLLEFAALFWVLAVATAAFSAVNERELRRRRYDIEALATMATKLETVREPAEAAAAVVDAIAETFDFEQVVMIASPDGSAPAVLAARRPLADAGAPRFDPQTSAVAHASAARRTLLVSALDPHTDPWLSAALPDARNVLVVPLSADDQQLGVLVAVQGRRLPSRIARRVIGMTERFVSHGTLALRGVWLLEQVRAMANTDGLTGVANRAALDAALDREIARAARQMEDAALVLLDLDHFKALNDRHGHQTGDDVLCRVGAVLAQGCREIDLAARYGGEEFALLLPATGREEALEVAERLRCAIAEAGQDLAVTISAGVATFPLDAADATGLVAAADAALYASKHAGRNRVTAATPPQAPAAA